MTSENIFILELFIFIIFTITATVIIILNKDFRRYLLILLTGLLFLFFSRLFILVIEKPYLSLTLTFVGLFIIFYSFIRLVKLILSMKRLEKIAIYDSLTGVYNRVFLEELLKDKIEKAIKLDHVFSIILIDLNNFKLINDKFGHVTGDAVLSIIANKIKDSLRHNDIVGRWGGDEFLVFIPDDPCVNVLNIIYRLQNKVFFEKEGIKITLSTGYACFPKDGKDLETLLKKADERMYKVKRIIKEAERHGVDYKSKKEI